MRPLDILNHVIQVVLDGVIGMGLDFKQGQMQIQLFMGMMEFILQRILIQIKLCYVVAVGAVGPMRALFVRICTMVLRARTTTLAFAVAVVNLVPGIWKSKEKSPKGRRAKKRGRENGN